MIFLELLHKVFESCEFLGVDSALLEKEFAGEDHVPRALGLIHALAGNVKVTVQAVGVKRSGPIAFCRG